MFTDQSTQSANNRKDTMSWCCVVGCLGPHSADQTVRERRALCPRTARRRRAHRAAAKRRRPSKANIGTRVRARRAALDAGRLHAHRRAPLHSTTACDDAIDRQTSAQRARHPRAARRVARHARRSTSASCVARCSAGRRRSSTTSQRRCRQRATNRHRRRTTLESASQRRRRSRSHCNDARCAHAPSRVARSHACRTIARSRRRRRSQSRPTPARQRAPSRRLRARRSVLRARHEVEHSSATRSIAADRRRESATSLRLLLSPTRWQSTQPSSCAELLQ